MPADAARPVRVTGLKELRRDLRKMSKELDKEVRGALKDSVADVADDAKAIARGKFDGGTGKTIKSIRPGVSGSKALVRVSAQNQGFHYPRRHEYENDGAKAFLGPALSRNSDKVEENVLDALENLAQRQGRFRGNL